MVSPISSKPHDLGKSPQSAEGVTKRAKLETSRDCKYLGAAAGMISGAICCMIPKQSELGGVLIVCALFLATLGQRDNVHAHRLPASDSKFLYKREGGEKPPVFQKVKSIFSEIFHR